MGDPWLSIVGIGEDSLAGLPAASLEALDAAEVIFGGPRHLELAQVDSRGQPWPVPFSVEPVLACRGQRVAVLASGDPFWHGAGGSLVQHLERREWRAYPAPSTFSRAAAVMGWRMEDITCHGLHAAPLARLRSALVPHGRMICLLRNGDSPAKLAAWLCAQACGAAQLTVLERLGGMQERVRAVTACDFDLSDVAAPVAVAVTLPGGIGLPRSGGLPDTAFTHDGQITKRPVRAMTLSTLGPRPGELLWDIGAGSGSISMEWCLAGGQAIAFEQRANRCANIWKNAADFGVEHRLTLAEGDAGMNLRDHPLPDAVFVGGGANMGLLETLFDCLKGGTRLAMSGVTLETESLLATLHAEHGGDLLRIELAQSAPLGRMRGWVPARPVIQWSVTL